MHDSEEFGLARLLPLQVAMQQSQHYYIRGTTNDQMTSLTANLPMGGIEINV
jgi:hypothetical protein